MRAQLATLKRKTSLLGDHANDTTVDVDILDPAYLKEFDLGSEFQLSARQLDRWFARYEADWEIFQSTQLFAEVLTQFKLINVRPESVFTILLKIVKGEIERSHEVAS